MKRICFWSSLFSFSFGKITHASISFFYYVGTTFPSLHILFFWQEVMGSRRMTRSSFSNGRSSSGEDSNGTSRPNSCSYISNVRPENRYRTKKVPFVTLLLQTRSQAHIICFLVMVTSGEISCRLGAACKLCSMHPILQQAASAWRSHVVTLHFIVSDHGESFQVTEEILPRYVFSFAFKKVKPLQCVAN